MCTRREARALQKKKNKKKTERMGRIQAVDLDMKVKDDHRKLADRKVGNIWTVVVYIWG